MKIVGVDYGSARTGVAVSDPSATIARPLGVVERAGSEAGLARLVELIRSEEAERVVVGLPLFGADERELPALAAAARQRLALLPARVTKPVVVVDDDF